PLRASRAGRDAGSGGGILSRRRGRRRRLDCRGDRHAGGGRRVSRVIQERLAYQFRKPELLETALTHRSRGVVGKNGAKPPGNNEKLEFLGDAVLDLAVSDLLMRHFPRYQEGDLSKLRASLVNARILAEKARALGLGEELRLGKGEEKSGGR